MNKSAWSWVAIALIVAGTGWGLRERERLAAPQATVATTVAAENGTPTLRLAGKLDAPTPIRFDAAMARRALKTGTLEVALPDGTTYPVRIEHQQTHGGGQWSLVGRVATPMGGQAMVLTFGANAVFGLLPMPDGHALRITTGPNGVVKVAPAGGLSPDRAPVRPGAPDYRVPDVAPPQAPIHHGAAARPASASRPTRVQPAVGGTPQANSAMPPRASAPVDTTPVQIDVLALYSPELVTLRGSKAAAETDVANQFALANQAHIDSGSRVRLNMVGLRQVALPTTYTNQGVLDTLTQGKYWDTDFEALRDDNAADLVAYIRPRPTVEDDTCGASWLNGGNYAAVNNLNARHAGVVVNVDPCGPYVLAHEIGHAMGSAHDKYTQRNASGVIAHGAYAFSFGLRTQTFGTIMADPGDATWLGRFSGPDQTGCDGAPCGEAERIDNVRSLNLMAPAIAAFRGPKNTIAIADATASEALGQMTFAIRLSAPAPAGGLPVHVDFTGGTATLTEDYWDWYNHDLTIPQGEREVLFPVYVRDDRPQRPVVETPEETVLLHLTAPAGYTVTKADAVGTILDDDPRPVVTLKIRAPDGVTLPDNFDVTWIGSVLSDTATDTEWMTKTGPNEWSAPLLVAAGAPFRFSLPPSIQEAAYLNPVQLDEVWEDRTVEVLLERTVRVTGTIRLAPGMIKPFAPPSLDVNQYIDGVLRGPAWASFPVDQDHFVMYVIPGATIEASINEMPYPVDGNTVRFEPWAARIQDVRHDFVLDPVRSSVKSAIGRPLPVTEGEDAIIEFEQIAVYPDAAVTVAWHTVDGTAKAGVDYLAASGTTTIGADQRVATIAIATIDNDDNTPGRTFDVVVDAITGAQMRERVLHVDIRNDDGRTGGAGQKFRAR